MEIAKIVDFTKFFSLSERENSVEKREIHCHANLFPSNQLILKFFSKALI